MSNSAVQPYTTWTSSPRCYTVQVCFYADYKDFKIPKIRRRVKIIFILHLHQLLTYLPLSPLIITFQSHHLLFSLHLPWRSLKTLACPCGCARVTFLTSQRVFAHLLWAPGAHGGCLPVGWPGSGPKPSSSPRLGPFSTPPQRSQADRLFYHLSWHLLPFTFTYRTFSFFIQLPFLVHTFYPSPLLFHHPSELATSIQRIKKKIVLPLLLK